MQDQIFKQPLEKILPFTFDQNVAACFDNMISRSVPFYRENIELLIEIVKNSIQADQCIYDLGCSTGNVLFALAKEFQNFAPKLIGIDQSQAMINEAMKKMNCDSGHNIKFYCDDIRHLSLKKDSAVIIMNYTLQFIALKDRQEIINKISNALKAGGIFFYSEKITTDDELINKMQTKIYHDFKRKNGYSDLEIEQKQTALKNVLIPKTIEEHMHMLKQASFSHAEVIFRWNNFATFIGIK